MKNTTFPAQFIDEEIITNHEPKHHTIRSGTRFKAGDFFSPRVWTGKPYASKQIQFHRDIEVKRTWKFEFTEDQLILIDDQLYAYTSSTDALRRLAGSDGLTQVDFFNWFPKPFKGQIICWNENLAY
jgi:hypothetical protein